MQSMETIQFVLGMLSSFLSKHFSMIVAAFVLWLAYRLLRIGLEKVSRTGDVINWALYAAFIAPGVGFAIVGVVFIMGLDPLSLMIYLLTLTVLVGFGFAFLGYRLFDKGILGLSDVEAAWKDKKLLLKQAAPGTIYALFGLAMIGTSIWLGPRILHDYNENERVYHERVIAVIDERSKEALAILKKYLDQKK